MVQRRVDATKVGHRNLVENFYSGLKQLLLWRVNRQKEPKLSRTIKEMIAGDRKEALTGVDGSFSSSRGPSSLWSVWTLCGPADLHVCSEVETRLFAVEHHKLSLNIFDKCETVMWHACAFRHRQEVVCWSVFEAHRRSTMTGPKRTIHTVEFWLVVILVSTTWLVSLLLCPTILLSSVPSPHPSSIQTPACTRLQPLPHLLRTGMEDN